MLRPKLRPTLSRKVKYWGIAPQAHRKLGKEARRGSHDLRRLVGHANFLDELIEEFHIDDEAENPKYQQAILKKATAVEAKKSEPTEYDDGEDTASDSWSEYDSDDDDEHALVRTQSGRLQRVEADAKEDDEDSSDGEEIYGMMPALIKDVGSSASSAETSPASIIETTQDYFNHVNVATVADSVPEKGAEAVTVEIASPMSVKG